MRTAEEEAGTEAWKSATATLQTRAPGTDRLLEAIGHMLIGLHYDLHIIIRKLDKLSKS